MERDELTLAFKMDIESKAGMTDKVIIGRAFIRHITEATNYKVRKKLFYSCEVKEEGKVHLKVYFGSGKGPGLLFVFETPTYMPEIKETAEHVNAWALLQMGD